MKQQDITIKVPAVKNGKEVKYLSDFTHELPKNCILSKGGTGVGGTHLALTSNENYIICVPFVSLVDNKCAQHPGVLGVKKGVTQKDIKFYLDSLNDDEPAKIMVTYDSLGKIVALLGDGCKEFNILIDELHLLFTQYSFRREAVQIVLSNYKKFKSYTFMTATQMDSKYTLKELRNELVVTYDWVNKTNVTVNSIYTENVVDSVNTFIEVMKDKDVNLYFFVNSVACINAICDYLGLDDTNARMICSNNYAGPKTLEISNTSSAPKKINFLTSTAFEGCDLYDEKGVIIMISDGRKANTLLDISTSVIQIAGRIRNTRYNEEIYHIYTTTRYNGITKEEFNDLCDRDIELAHGYEEDYAKLSDTTIAVTKCENYYIQKIDEKLVFDENAVLIDKFNFDVHHNYQFTTRLNDEYRSNGVKIQEMEMVIRKNLNVSTIKKLSFKESMAKLEGEFNFNEAFKEQCFYRWPFLPQAIETLGFEKMKALHYIIKTIKEELVKTSNQGDTQKIIKLMKLCGFTNNEFISSKDLKAKMQSVYDKLNMGKAKASDVEKYFDVKEYTKRVDGKVVKGFTIIRSKIVF